MNSEISSPEPATALPLQLSSDVTAVYKYVLPIALGGFALLAAVAAVTSSDALMPAVVLGAAAIAAALAFRRLRRVSLTANELIVWQRSEPLRIPLSEIADVRYAPWSSPPLATISFRNLTVAGREVKLIPRGAGLVIQGRALAELRHRLAALSGSPHDQSRRGA